MGIFSKKADISQCVIPAHIGIIMDGNGRWAKKRGLPRFLGHAQGGKTFRAITRYCSNIGVKYVTYYAFSTENWSRPQEEIDAGYYSPGRYMWVLKDVTPIDPIPAKGHLGIWNYEIN